MTTTTRREEGCLLACLPFGCAASLHRYLANTIMLQQLAACTAMAIKISCKRNCKTVNATGMRLRACCCCHKCRQNMRHNAPHTAHSCHSVLRFLCDHTPVSVSLSLSVCGRSVFIDSPADRVAAAPTDELG